MDTSCCVENSALENLDSRITADGTIMGVAESIGGQDGC